MSNIEIHLPTAVTGGKERIALDGVDITRSLTGIGFTARANERSHAILELDLPVVEVNAEARVEVTPQQQALLLALGWTPPKGEPVKGDDEQTDWSAYWPCLICDQPTGEACVYIADGKPTSEKRINPHPDRRLAPAA